MGFPDDETALEVASAFGANLTTDPDLLTYEDITDYVKPQITITRGRTARSATTRPTTIGAGLRNPDGIFSPRNINGPHYGSLRQDTPLRARLDPGAGMVTRAIAYVPDWPPEWTGPDIDDRIPVTAAGTMQRLNISRKSVTPSPITRTIMSAASITPPLAYYPLNDGPEAVQLANYADALVHGTILTPARPGEGGDLAGNPTLLGFTPDDGTSSHAFSVPNTNIDLPVSTHTPTGTYVITFWHRFHLPHPLDGPTRNYHESIDTTLTINPDQDPTLQDATTVYHRVDMHGGTVAHVDFRLQQSANSGSSDHVYLNVRNAGHTFIAGPDGAVANLSDGGWHEIQARLVQNGSNIDTTLYVDNVQIGTTSSGAATIGTLVSFAGGAYGGVIHPWIPAFQDETWAAYGLANVSIHTSAGVGRFYDAGLGYVGELAAVRFGRICNEEGLLYDVTPGATEPMGPQQAASTLDILRECEAADEAVMIERRTGELGFDPRVSRYNIAVTMTLDYEAGHISGRLGVDDSTQDSINRATVTRAGGSSETVERVTGPRGSDPATGIGPYPDGPTRSLATDAQALQHAGWIVNVGTVDEPRYVVTVDLATNPDLVDAWLACDVGSRILITNPPAIQVGPAPLDVILEGYDELVDGVLWLLTLYLEPYRPYEVLQIESGSGNRSRIPAGVSTLDATYEGQSTLSVTSAVVRWVDSATYPTRFPILIEIAGEVMTCTAITGTGLTQTFTVTRGLHGIVKRLPAGSAVQIWRAPVIAL